MTEIKGEIDNVTVSMLNGEDVMGGEEDESMGDFEADFGEFDADMGDEDLGDMEGLDGISDIDDSIEPISRESK